MLGVGDFLSLACVLLGIIGGLMNINPNIDVRNYSFIIWTVANVIGAILNTLAYMEIVTLTLGFALFAVLNGIYAGIDVWGVYNTRKEMRNNHG